MKWFKHESQARNDERIARLEDKAGLEGYGFYFKLLEIVSSKMDATSKCDVTYSLTSWGRQANVTTKKAVFLLQSCHDVGLIIAQRCGDDMVVNIPNLLKYRDNHTKNLQATSKQELELDKELEVDKELEKTKAKSADKSAVEILPTPDFIDAELWKDFIEVRKGLKAKNTLPAIKALITQLEKLKNEGHDPAEVIKTSIRSSWKDLYPLKTNTQSAGINSKLSIAEQNKQSTEIARQRLFGAQPQEKDITNETARV